MSKDLVMHGPAEFDMQVYMINDDTGQQCVVTIGLSVFEFPTPEKIQERLDKLNNGGFNEQLSGFRLMSKEEAFDYVMLEKTGQTFALPGGAEWDDPIYSLSERIEALSEEKLEQLLTNNRNAVYNAVKSAMDKKGELL